MNKIVINGSTDIFLENVERGKGKIIVSDPYMGAYNHFWGAMGSNIEKFIKGISSDYFINKLMPDPYVFSGKLTVKNIRKHIKEEFSYELPYWKFMSGQKELREKMKEMESCDNQYEFVDMCFNMPKNLMCLDLTGQEEKEFIGIVKSIFTEEPWHFIEKTYSPQAIWLGKILFKLKKKL